MARRLFFAATVLWGILLIAGCGVATTLSSYSQSQISNHRNTLSSPNNTPLKSPSSSPSTSSASPSPTPSRSLKTPSSSAIAYTNSQKVAIRNLGQTIGLTHAYIPTVGFHSQFIYAQKILAAGGGYMLTLNYNNFSIQEYTKPMLTGRAILRKVSLTIPGSSTKTPIIGIWNTPPPGSGAQPILTFQMNGTYYLMGTDPVSQTEIDTIAESLKKS